MLVLHAERVAVGEPMTDDDFRLVIMPSAVPGGFNKGHDFLTAPKGVANRHERKGTVIGEQGAKVLIVVGRDHLQVGLNEGLIRLTDHFFLHRFSCFLYSLKVNSCWFVRRIGGQRVTFAGTFPTALPRTNHAPFNAVSSPGLLCPFRSKSSGPSRPTSVSRTRPCGTSPCTWPSHAPRRVVTPAITIAAPSPCASQRLGDPQVTRDLRSVFRYPRSSFLPRLRAGSDAGYRRAVT